MEAEQIAQAIDRTVARMRDATQHGVERGTVNPAEASIAGYVATALEVLAHEVRQGAATPPTPSRTPPTPEVVRRKAVSSQERHSRVAERLYPFWVSVYSPDGELAMQTHHATWASALFELDASRNREPGTLVLAGSPADLIDARFRDSAVWLWAQEPTLEWRDQARVA